MRDAARALVGVQFRLHGRDPATGLDCVGLVVTAARQAGLPAMGVPDDYRLRGADPAVLSKALRRNGWRKVNSGARDGDIVVTMPGDRQTHLMVQDGPGFIHAHAGLGRVVAMHSEAGDAAGDAVVARWRFAAAGGEA